MLARYSGEYTEMEIAAFTGYSLRRTSASLASDAGCSIIELKGLGSWRSTSAALGYVERSKYAKKKVTCLSVCVCFMFFFFL